MYRNILTKISDENQIPPNTITNTIFILLCVPLLILLLLGVALFYSGLTQRKSSFQQLGTPFILASIILPLWLCFGYTLAYSDTASSSFLGNFEYVGLRKLNHVVMIPHSTFNGTSSTITAEAPTLLPSGNIVGQTTVAAASAQDGVLALAHCVYQALFACICCALAMGCIVDRGRLVPSFVFVVAWLFLVYCPICYWIWNDKGWINEKLEVLDIAGGHVVHLVSGLTGFIYSWFLDYRSEHVFANYRASNLGFVVLGTVLMITGWIGFNCGSLYSVNLLTVAALANTLNTCFVSGFSWFVLDYFMLGYRKLSIVGFCSGCIAGLVAITPGTAYVDFWSTFIIGALSGILCNLATRLKYYCKVDDALDIFSIHFVGGVIGNLLTGLFADKNIARMGGIEINGGWMNRHYIQLLDQFLSSLAVVAYVFFMCFTILVIINKLPYCQLRVSEEEELKGLDESQLGGEFMADFVEFIRELNPTDYVEVESHLLESHHSVIHKSD